MIVQEKLGQAKDARTAFEKLDVDQNTRIQAAELCAYLRAQNVPRELVSDAQINYLFRKFSACDAAVLTPAEFRALLDTEPTNAARVSAKRRLGEFPAAGNCTNTKVTPETLAREEKQAEPRLEYSEEELMHSFANALNERAQNRYPSLGRAFRDAVDADGRATRESVSGFVRKLLPEVDDRRLAEFIDYAVSEAGVQGNCESEDGQEVPMPVFRKMMQPFEGKQVQLIWKDFCDHSARAEKLASPEVKPAVLPE